MHTLDPLAALVVQRPEFEDLICDQVTAQLRSRGYPVKEVTPIRDIIIEDPPHPYMNVALGVAEPSCTLTVGVVCHTFTVEGSHTFQRETTTDFRVSVLLTIMEEDDVISWRAHVRSIGPHRGI